MTDELEARIETLERTITDGERDLSHLAAAGETAERLDRLEEELSELTDRIDELDAAAQALRGYVGNIRSVNTDVEQRADAALAKVESLEASLDGNADDRESDDSERSHSDSEGFWDGHTGPVHAPQAKDDESNRMEPENKPTDQDNTSQTCTSCGRPRQRQSRSTSAGSNPPVPGGAETADRHPGTGAQPDGDFDDDPIPDPALDHRPDSPDDAGTIQRIRNML